MRLFLSEYTCSPSASERDLPVSLRSEGRAMLAALAADLAHVPDTTLTLLLGLGLPEIAGARCVRCRREEEGDVFRALAGQHDLTLAIAPEFEDLLTVRCQWTRDAGGCWLGSELAAIRLTADKLALCEHLHRRGVRTPPCLTVTCPPYPAVLKPRFGAGSQATFLVWHERELAGCIEAAKAETNDELLLQPFVSGLAASVAFLIGPGLVVPLQPAEQHLSADGRFRYLGGSLPLPEGLAERALCLGRGAVEAVEGLRGYVGVDLVLGAAADGSQDQVIEINPRLTTSYLGQRCLARTNLAGLLRHVFTGEEPLPPSWQEGRVQFTAEGVVSFLGGTP